MMTDDELKQIISQWGAEPPTDNRTDTICSDADLLILARRIEAKAREELKADQWWDYHDGETGIVDLNQWLDDEFADSDWPRETFIGQQYRFSAAKMLPDEYYEVAPDGDEGVKLVSSTKEKWEARRAIRTGGAV